MQDVFRDKFKKLGFRVLISADANNALKRYQQTPYHALLVDSGTAGMPGLEAYRSVLREAAAMYLDLAGMLILNDDQAHWAGQATGLAGGATFVRPVGLKQLSARHLRAILPCLSSSRPTPTTDRRPIRVLRLTRGATGRGGQGCGSTGP